MDGPLDGLRLRDELDGDYFTYLYHSIDGIVQEKCNSIANTLELSLSCTNS